MRKNTLIISLHILIWLLVYLLPYTITYDLADLPAVIQEPGAVAHAISTLLLIGYTYLNYYLLAPKLYLHRRYIAFALIAAISLLVIIRLPQAFSSFKPQLPRTTHGLNGSHPLIAPGDIGVPKPGYPITLFAISMVVSIRLRHQQQLLEVQPGNPNPDLGLIAAQVNPHFLFHLLNSIYASSLQKADDTPKALIQLHELMRYILKDVQADSVALDQELNYINNYVALQKRRFGNTVKIDYIALTGVVNRRIAPLTLIPFIENAFKHGVNPEQNSAINISIMLRNDELLLHVVNNKVTAIQQEETMDISLRNAALRLERRYRERHKLDIKNGEKTFSVTLTLMLNN